MTLFAWAYEVAEFKLADALPDRWAHSQGVARQARGLHAVSGSDADLLESAAILHDVGYAPDLAHIGFHPLDGANFLHDLDAPARLIHLVAHHSYAALEADFRDLSAEIWEFEDERGSLRDALWYCDLTIASDGQVVDARDRIAGIQERYGSGHLVTQFITEASPELLAAVDRTKRRAVALTG